MRSLWHERIQRYADGQADAEEAAAFEASLNQDAELRALYLDYMNLDMALAAAAAENGPGIPRPPIRLTLGDRRWLVMAAAACLALALWALLPGHRDRLERPDIAAISISSAQNAIARLVIEPQPAFPAWVSPTASLLAQPRSPQ